MKRNLAILFTAYVISWSLIAIGYGATASVGYSLAPTKGLVLLPLIFQIFGASLIAVPASRLMMTIGRQKAFMVGSGLGILGGLLCSYGVYTQNFWLLSFSALFIGMLNGFGEFLKFAAADEFEDEKRKNRAISIIVSGGIVAAFLGPTLADISNRQFEAVAPYLGPYLLVAVLSGLSLVMFLFYRNVAMPQPAASADQNPDSAASKYAILTNPVFFLGTSLGVLAYLVMSVIMDAFPMTMMSNGMGFSHTTSVLQWHFLAMFAPSYLTSLLIARYGFTATALAGIVINAIGIGFAFEGTEFHNFLISLVLVGLGWNLMYLTGTSLIANLQGGQRKHAEGWNNLFITGTYALATPISAFVVTQFGWVGLCYFSAVLVALAAGIVGSTRNKVLQY